MARDVPGRAGWDSQRGIVNIADGKITVSTSIPPVSSVALAAIFRSLFSDGVVGPFQLPLQGLDQNLLPTPPPMQ
jgi:hypothetical protein